MLLMKITMYKKIVLIFTLLGILLLSGCGLMTEKTGTENTDIETPDIETPSTETPSTENTRTSTATKPIVTFTINSTENITHSGYQPTNRTDKVKMEFRENDNTLYLEIPTTTEEIKIEFNAAKIESYHLLKSGKIDDKTSAVIFEMTLVTNLSTDPIVHDYLKLNEIGYFIRESGDSIPLTIEP